MTRQRNRYQQEVERLLDQIQQQMGELRRLKAVGATRRALADRKQRLQRTREHLARLTTVEEAQAARAA